MTSRDDRNANAFYMHAPSEMMTTAIALALHVACGLIAERQSRALTSLIKDSALCTRAARMILNYLMRSMADRVDPTPKQFDTLVHEVIALTKEQ